MDKRTQLRDAIYGVLVANYGNAETLERLTTRIMEVAAPHERLSLDQAERACTQTMPTDLDYSRFIERIDGSNVRLIHGVLGLMSEVGEIADALKKWFMYGRALDRVNVFEEGGDVSWYLRLIAHSLRDVAGGEYGFSEMIERNIRKLQARYGDKFTESAALTRDLDAERRILEGGK